MSLHKSLKGKSGLVRHRNVLTRAERIEKLQQEERWKEGQAILGLPKVRSIKIKRKATKKKEAEGVEGVVAEPAAPAKEAKK